MEGGGHQTPATLRTALDREPSLVINTATLSGKGLSTNDVATTKNQVSLKKMTKYSKEGIRNKGRRKDDQFGASKSRTKDYDMMT